MRLKENTKFKDSRGYEIYTKDKVIYEWRIYIVYRVRDTETFVLVSELDMKYGRGPIEEIKLNRVNTKEMYIVY